MAASEQCAAARGDRVGGAEGRRGEAERGAGLDPPGAVAVAEALTAEAEAVGRRMGGRVGGEAEAGADAVDEGEGGIGTESARCCCCLPVKCSC